MRESDKVLKLKSCYFRYIGMIESTTSFPPPELTPYIEKYVFYENANITNDVHLKMFSNGKIEMFIQYNDSHILITNGKKEISLNNFISGIFALTNTIRIRLKTKKSCFKGIIITFSFLGIIQLLNFQLISFTNKIVLLESIFGEKGKIMVEKISMADSNQERENILNKFFLILLYKIEKKKFAFRLFII